jgi:hypothetical protein
VLTRDARPGQRFVVAVFGINGPISASPRNYIWLRSATLDVYSAGRAATGEQVELEVDGEFPAASAPERIADGFDGIEALLPMPDGSLLVSVGHTVYRWHDGVVSVFRTKADARALALSSEELLTIAQRDRVLRVNPHGDTTVLAKAAEPRALLWDDDSLVVADADGIHRDGLQISAAPVCALARANGRIYAVDHEGGILTVEATGVDVFCDLEDDPGDIAVDQEGRLYVAGSRGIALFAPDGDRLDALRLPEPAGALAFRGSDLFAAGHNGLYRIRLTTKGAS